MTIHKKNITVIIATNFRNTLIYSLKSLFQYDGTVELIYVTPKINFGEITKLHLDILSNTDYTLIEDKGGLYECLNYALQIVNTDFVCFLHDDDWYGFNFINEGLEFLNRNDNAAWCFGDVIQIKSDGTPSFLESSPYYYEGIELELPRLWHPCAIYRSRVFQEVGFYRSQIQGIQIKIAADYDWFLRAEFIGQRGIKNQKMQYFMREGGISTTEQTLSLRECILIVQDLYPHKGVAPLWFKKYPHFKLLTSNSRLNSIDFFSFFSILPEPLKNLIKKIYFHFTFKK